MNLDRLGNWLREAAIDAACVTNPVSVAYLTGFESEPHERLLALVATPSRAVIVLPQLELGSAESAAIGTELRPVADGEDPYAAVAEALGGSLARLAVEKDHLTVAAKDRLAGLVTWKELVDAAPWIRSQRIVKTEKEVDLLAQAAALTDRVLEEVFQSIHAGQSELEVAANAEVAFARAGTTPAFGTAVASGPNSALPHLKPTSRRLQRGDLVLVDLGATQDGYKADITRVAVIGSPDERQRELHRLVVTAHDRALERVRDGLSVAEIDRAAREVIERAGLGERFIHRTGHGLGRQEHEEPSLTAGSDVVLQAGMVVTIEPGVYIPGWGGIRIEDDVVVERDGCRVLTRAAPDLRLLPA